MTMQEFYDEKKRIQGQIDDVIEQLKAIKNVGIDNAEGIVELHDSICLAADRVASAQSQFRMLLRAQYMPDQKEQACEWPEDEPEYEEEIPQQQAQVEPDPAMQQQAMLQNIITGITALAGAYGIFKSLKK